jgi:hypothetical protein
MSEPEKETPDKRAEDDKAYQLAARLLGQKLGVDWHTLDPDAVREYMRKIEIVRGKQ